MLVLVIAVSMGWTQQAALPALGESADGLHLTGTDGARLRLDALTAPGPLLLLVTGSSEARETCEIAKRFSTLPIPEGLMRMVAAPVIASPAQECKGAGAVRPARIAGASISGPVIALIVDDSIHVRLRMNIEPHAAGWEALSSKVNQWLQGRQTYEANCGHCHGFDGAQASAPETKSLVGITRKYPETRVLELGSQFGGVDMTGWSDAKKEILLTYLRGL